MYFNLKYLNKGIFGVTNIACFVLSNYLSIYWETYYIVGT